MQIMTDVPDELFTTNPVLGLVSTPVGELLGPVNEQPAGAWTAVVLDGIDVGELASADLPDYLTAAARARAWVDGLIVAGVQELARRADVPRADVEVAVALAEPVGAAQRRIWQAGRLRHLPETSRMLRSGQLSERHAMAMVEATAPVDDPELVGEVERRALRCAAGKTATELRKHARRILTRLDPEAAERRAVAARDDADVTFEPVEDGMSEVYARMPVEDGLLVKQAVDAYAITAKQAGDSRRVGVLRSEALTGWAADYLTGRNVPSDGTNAGAGRGPAPRSGGRPIEIGVVIGLGTALGHDPLPAEVPGCGLVPREAVARMITTEAAKLRLLVVDDTTGRLIHRGTDSYRPTPDQIAQVRATWVTSAGPGSQVLATRCDLDHVIPHPTGPTSVDNLLPEDRTWHVAKTKTSLSVTIDHDGSAQWNTPLGQTRTVRPYDYLLTDDADNNDD